MSCCSGWWKKVNSFLTRCGIYLALISWPQTKNPGSIRGLISTQILTGHGTKISTMQYPTGFKKVIGPMLLSYN